MNAVLSAAQMSELDARAQRDFGIPGLVLMEHAGSALSEALKRHMSECRCTRAGSSCIYVVAGRGNNGGDGLVVARLAAIEGQYRVVIVDAGCTEAAPSSQTAVHLASCRALGVPVVSGNELAGVVSPGDWIVDAISGTGIKGPLTSEKQRLVEQLNAIVSMGARRSEDGERSGRPEVPVASCSRPFVFAVDVPSGLGDEFEQTFPVLSADVTATVGWYKRCLLTPAGRRHCGSIELLDIFFPRELDPDTPEIAYIEEQDIGSVLPLVPETAHKGTRGHLAVVAGAQGSAGAALLCSAAASNARAGLVSLFTDTAVASRIEGLRPQLMVRGTSDPVADMRASGRRIDALLVGPGWGHGRERRNLLPDLLAMSNRGVIDADALTLLAHMEPDEFSLLTGGDWLLTPHPAECARLAGRSVSDVLERPDLLAAEVADKYGATVLLKASTSWIADPHGLLRVFDGTHRAAGTGGSGDVLAGVCGALMASGLGSFAAATAAAVIHARAVQQAFAASGWFNADTLAASIGAAIVELEQTGGNYR